MTVVFQEKFIYMPYMPPFARSEQIADYDKDCRPVTWREERIRSGDGTKIALAVGDMPSDGEGKSDLPSSGDVVGPEGKGKNVVICYFQGNGASLPPRLPLLSNVLKLLQARPRREGSHVTYTMVALSYRGYWTSSGKPTQPGIEQDAQALLNWVHRTFPSAPGPRTTGRQTEIIFWGQSLGAGVAATAVGTYLTDHPHRSPYPSPQGREQVKREASRPPITGLVLETPFTSIKSMLLSLYPQKWLPYQYLHPFLRNHWDMPSALHQIAASRAASGSASDSDASGSGGGGRTDGGDVNSPPILLVNATRDEIVPSAEVERIEAVCRRLTLECERKGVIGALHNEATMRREGQEAVARFIERVS